MKRKFKDIIITVLLTFMLIGFKHIQGFENTVCFIAAVVMVELLELNGKK